MCVCRGGGGGFINYQGGTVVWIWLWWLLEMVSHVGTVYCVFYGVESNFGVVKFL